MGWNCRCGVCRPGCSSCEMKARLTETCMQLYALPVRIVHTFGGILLRQSESELQKVLTQWGTGDAGVSDPNGRTCGHFGLQDSDSVLKCSECNEIRGRCQQCPAESLQSAGQLFEFVRVSGWRHKLYFLILFVLWRYCLSFSTCDAGLLSFLLACLKSL